MQRVNTVFPVMTMLIACVGCGGGGGGAQSSTPMGSTSAPTTSPPGSSAPPPPPAASAPAAPGKIDDSDAAIIYSRGNDKTSNWSHFQPSPEDYQQGEHSSNFVRGGGPVSGAGVVVNFSGTGITWIGKQGPNYGVASYSLDGGPAKTVDTYNSKQVNQNPNLTISGLASESHVLSISLTAKKNAASSGYYQTVDAFDVEGSALAASQASVAGYGSSELKFAGQWDGGRVSDGSDLSGGHYWSNQAKSSISWTFVGSLIEVFGRPDYEDGYMDVYIDTNPNPVASVDAHWGSSDDDTLNACLLFAKKLSPGQHTIKLVVAGKHGSGARDNYVQIDELVAFQ
ncbi:MAG TPA: hypothetical protein VI653_24530 [Steroidobacteraceae bacterium]